VVREKKAVHESLWGTSIFQSHEIALLDTPLIQRLRLIAQTGLVFLVYPSAMHSRFEHTLGVTTLVDKFVDSLNQAASAEIAKFPNGGDYAELRLAALLHDCGHAFLSHVSEMVYKWDTEIRKLKQLDQFAHCKPHEILSYCIIRSEFFRDFFKNNIEVPYGVEIDLERVADLVVGNVPNKEKAYLTRIINGAFDADKLDYISRDGYFTGLRLTIDIDRLFYTLRIHEFSNGLKDLAMTSPVPLQHILFSKMLLYTTVYNHHKVKACDCMVKGLIEYCQLNGHNLGGRSLNRAANFLRLTDHDLFNRRDRKNPVVRRMIRNICDRNLFKRACVICRDTVRNYDGCVPELLERINQSPEEHYHIRSLVYDHLPESVRKQYTIHEIWVDLPESPSLREAAQTFIVGERSPVELNKLFPMDGWLKAYADKQLRGHVFGPAEIQHDLNLAATAALSEPGFDLDPTSRTYCHLPASQLD
jgi:HD superfamily phosphohydrolase